MSESFIPPEFLSVYKKIAAAIKNKRITPDTIIYAAGIVMEILELNSDLTSQQKKDLVPRSLKEIIRTQSDLPEDQKTMLYNSIDTIVPGAVDLIIAGTKGELNINLEAIGCGCFKSTPAKSTRSIDLVNTNMKKKKKKSTLKKSSK